MGDREKCIQAQMDEYLSKPLQQNHLIQTILKCATLGGALLEKNRDRDISRQVDVKAAGAINADTPSEYLRPPLPRFATAAEHQITGMDSPAIITADQEDPLSRARNCLSEPRDI